jgi:hypothetical protein
MSPHLQVRLTSACRSLYVLYMIIIQWASRLTTTRQPNRKLGGLLLNTFYCLYNVLSSVLKFREVWLWRNLRGTYADLWQNLRRTSASWLRSLSLLDPSIQRQRVGKLMIDMTSLVP